MSYASDLSKILFMLGEIYSTDITDPLVDAWVAVLTAEQITIEQAKAAAIQIMRTRKYTKMPTPADVIDLIKPPMDCKLLAEEQADLVLGAVRSYRPGEPPEFEDPITYRLMKDRWPWGHFASSLETDRVKWWRKEFVEAYSDYAGQEMLPELKAPDPKLLEGFKDV